MCSSSSSAKARPSGSTSYLSLAPEHLRLEIGNTWMNPSTWGSGANVDAKIPPAPARVRDARLQTRRVQDGCPERARPRGARRAAGRVRRHPPKAHARPRRRAARLRVVRGDRRRLARREGGARAEDRGEALDCTCPVSAVGTGAECSSQSTSSVAAAWVRPSRRASRSAASSCATTPSSSCCAFRTRRSRPRPRTVPGHGRWVAHVSGATPLSALEPHTRRFGMHPLQTFTRSRGPEQLDGAWAAVSGESDEARAHGRELALTLGLRPFDLDDDARSLYHAGAAIASNYLVTLHRAASRLFEAAGAPPEALVPADDAHDRERLRPHGADRARRLGHRRRARARDPRRGAGARADVRRARGGDDAHEGLAHRRGDARGPRRGNVGLVPTMGALHAGHVSLLEAARRENDHVVMSLFVNEAQFASADDFARYPRDEERDARARRTRRRRRRLRAGRGRDVPAGIPHVGRVDGRARPRGRVPSRPLPGGRDGLPEALQHRPPAPCVLRPEGRAAGRGRAPA